jgi:hypothetical protein
MNTEELINQALRFLLNPIFINQRIHQIFNDSIHALEEGVLNGNAK